MLGTVNVTEVADQLFTFAAVVPTRTLPVLVPNPLPAIVTFTPAWPTVGPIEPTSGAAAVLVYCQTATECAGSVKFVTGLLPPEPVLTVIEGPLISEITNSGLLDGFSQRDRGLSATSNSPGGRLRVDARPVLSRAPKQCTT